MKHLSTERMKYDCNALIMRITTSYYEEKRKEYRDKQKVLNSKMAKLQVADEEYYLNSEYLLKIASQAKELFESSEPQEKRLLLKMALQNLRLEGKTVRYDWINPFDKVALYASRLDWLPLRDLFINKKLEFGHGLEQTKVFLECLGYSKNSSFNQPQILNFNQ